MKKQIYVFEYAIVHTTALWVFSPFFSVTSQTDVLYFVPEGQ